MILVSETFTYTKLFFTISNPKITFVEYQCWFAMRNGKKGPNQETGFGNRGPLQALIDTKFILNEHE